MFRYLLIILAIWAGVMIFRRLYLQKQNQPASKQLPEQNMVRCTHCGIHFPETDAIKDNQKIYCCDAHKLAAKK
jgi:uncharacterized protein